MDDFTRRRDEVFKEIQAEADGLLVEVSERLEIALKPERYLSDSDMQRANSRRDFVREDVDRLPFGDVPSLLREAELSHDVVEKWLASRYATIRADRELEVLRKSGVDGPDTERISGQLLSIRESVKRLEAQIQLPGAERRRESLEALKTEAASLAKHVTNKSLTHEERVTASWSPLNRS